MEYIIELLKTKNTLGEKIFAKHYPKEYNIIKDYTNKLNITDWCEIKYAYINQIKEIPKCKICSNNARFYKSHNRYSDTCCRECDKKLKSRTHHDIWKNYTVSEKISRLNKAADIREKKYGYSTPFANPAIQEKIKNTNISKYGVDNYFKTDTMKKIIKEKKEQINEKRFNTKITNGTLFASHGEKEIKEYIESLGFKTIKTQKYGCEIDIFIPEKNIGIEFNGSYFHSVNGINHKPINFHSNKTDIVNKHGIRLIHIWDDEWKYKQDIIKDILKSILNKCENKIYARQCEIKEIDGKVYKDFCNKHHLQGYRPATYKYGLFYNNKLVQICSFSKSNKYCEYEWIRGCFASNNAVIGGTSKLLNYFIHTIHPKSILCYADRNKFTGDSYIKSGFVLDGIVPQDKFYIDVKTGKRIARNPYKYKELMQLVKDGKLLLCYGAGSYRYILNLNYEDC